MSDHIQMYKNAVAINRERHAGWSIEGIDDYSFCQHLNSTPLMAVEFAMAASEYPVVFAGTETEVIPVAILGIRAEENLFVTPEHHWDAKYVPAFIRRYPFMFVRDNDRFVLCIDEQFPGINQEGRGQKLFLDDGKVSPYVENVLKFVRDYQDQFALSQRVCRRLKELGLLEAVQAQIVIAGGRRLSLGGFQAVNREKLKALPAETLAELIKTDEMELIYLHLVSMRNFERLRERVDARDAANAAEAPVDAMVVDGG